MLIRIAALLIAFAVSAFAADKSLRLPIGDPARKDKEAKLVLDAVTDTTSGELVTPGEMLERLAGARMIFLGESHTGMDFHLAQLRVIEGLHRMGKKVLIGLEMYPYTEQKHLDDWSAGLLTEEGFLRHSRWYRNWGFYWGYYRDLFLFARDHQLRMYAVNTPREVVSAVRKKGFQNLTPEEAAHIPSKIDTDSADHFTLFRAFFAEAEGMHSGMNEAQWRAMFEAQCTWDATMGHNAVRALKEHGDENTVMVVLIGSGHVAYNLGIQRQAAQWFDGKMLSVVPIRVVDGKDRPVEIVQASYADFLWGLPPEKDPQYPYLGISTTEAEAQKGRRVISVEKDTPGMAAGFRNGDVLLSMDGVSVHDRELFNRLLAEKRWGDAAAFKVLRGEEEIKIKVFFRRRPPAKP